MTDTAPRLSRTTTFEHTIAGLLTKREELTRSLLQPEKALGAGTYGLYQSLWP